MIDHSGAEAPSVPSSRQVQISEFGAPDVLRLVTTELPMLADNDVLIEVHACGVNFADILQRRNEYPTTPTPPFVPGYEAAGVVVAVGSRVREHEVGGRVVASLANGGYASHVVVDSARVFAIPPQIDPAAATALLVQGLTAYHAVVTHGKLEQGESLLVHAAAGGVGSLAVQIAKLIGGGLVLGTVGSEDKGGLITALGADVAINYRRQPDWPDRVRRETGGQGVDVILDVLGGAAVEEALSCLAPFGRIVHYGFTQGPAAPLAPGALLRGNHSLSGLYVGAILAMPEMLKPSLSRLFEWVSDGLLKVNVGATYPLNRASDAHAAIERRSTTGKVVLIP